MNMKKNIVLSNGKVEEMNIEGVLAQFDKQIRRTIIDYIGYDAFMANEEDMLQEGYIQCWKAFETYNEKNCFSTHLTWTIKGRLQALVKAKSTKKRDMSDFKIVNIDSETSFDSTKTIQDYIADDNIHIENEFQDRQLLEFLLDNIKNEEIQFLYLNLGLITITEIAKQTGTSKANISYKNKRFKAKLQNILLEYNAEVKNK